MKTKLRILLALFMSSTALLAATPNRQALYDCAYMGDDSFVEGVTIYHSVLGQREFFEVMVKASVAGDYRETFKEVHLVATYGGRVLTFGTGNFRVKINKVFSHEGKYRSFARIPEYNMHSENWTCKD